MDEIHVPLRQFIADQLETTRLKIGGDIRAELRSHVRQHHRPTRARRIATAAGVLIVAAAQAVSLFAGRQ